MKPRKLLILNGPPSSGKDTITSILYRHYDCRRLKFSAPLKKALMPLFCLDEDWMALEEGKDLKTMRFYNELSFREAQIWLSEKVMKPMFGPDIFGRLMLRQLYSPYQTNGRFDVISDAGFFEEVECVYQSMRSQDVYLMRVHRTDCTYQGDSRHYLEHPKIKSIDFHNEYPIKILPKIVCSFVHSWMELGVPIPPIVERPYTTEEIDVIAALPPVVGAGTISRKANLDKIKHGLKRS